MADRTSAEVFARVFEVLAAASKGEAEAVREIRAIAAAIHAIAEDYDFADYQMLEHFESKGTLADTLVALGWVLDPDGALVVPGGRDG